MAFKNFAGSALLPTIARLVLCAAFLPQGWLKCFTTMEFSGADAQRLQQMGVVTLPASGSGSPPAFNTSSMTLAPQDQPGGGEPDGDQAQPDNGNEQDGESAQPDGEAAESTAEQQPVTVQARKVYGVALMVDQAGWPYPVVLAWVAGLTEFLGGALLLVGLLSRVWALGLCIAMVVAFYLVTMDGAGNPQFGNSILNQIPLEFAKNTQLFNMAFSQIGLFICALLVLLVGPGPLSIDRVVVGRRRASRHADDIYTE